MNFFVVLGRMCFAIIFILSGINKVINWGESEQLLIHSMVNVLQKAEGIEWAQKGFDFLLPHSQELLLAATVVELICGLLIFLGIGVRFAALILALYLIPVTFFFHHFWWMQGMDAEMQMINFLKNLAIFGGALILVSVGGGPSKSKPLPKP